MVIRTIIFLVLNFGALAIAGYYTGDGVPSDWYTSLDKAPWTPPGWVFGFAWTTIMICFSLFMALLWPAIDGKISITMLYLVQWILNVAWSPLFFHYRFVDFALINISLLTVVVGIFLFSYKKQVAKGRWLALPYFVWLLLATSLNGYISLFN
ncbi:MAG: TspO/MBR family protein [Bacteroidota bacterium]